MRSIKLISRRPVVWTTAGFLLLACLAASGYARAANRLFLPLIFYQHHLPTPVPGRLLISEVCYHPGGGQPAGEWFELYNAGDLPLDLTGCKVGDAEHAGKLEGMYQFPGVLELPPGSTLVIAVQASAFHQQFGLLPDFEVYDSDPRVPDLIRYDRWATGRLELGNSGDELLALDREDEIVDAVSWGSSTLALNPAVKAVAPGHSIERYPPYLDTDQASDWRDQGDPSPGEVDLTPPTITPTPTPSITPTPTRTPIPSLTPTPTRTLVPSLTPTPTPTITLTPTPTRTPASTPPHGLVRLSEIMNFPLAGDPVLEWIEIFNPGGSAVDLGGLRIGDAQEPGGWAEGMYLFPAGFSLGPGQAAVIANHADYFRSVYNFSPDFALVAENLPVPTLIPDHGWAKGKMNLDPLGDEVLLLGAEGEMLDAVSWGASDWAFSPPAGRVSSGSSLERYPADVDTDRADDWREQPCPSPGEAALYK